MNFILVMWATIFTASGPVITTSPGWYFDTRAECHAHLESSLARVKPSDHFVVQGMCFEVHK